MVPLHCDNFSGIISLLLDSGASRHMTCHRDILFNVVDIAPVFITLLNGAQTTSCHEGNIFFSSKLLLQNVLYVPNLKCYLVFIPQLI